MPLARQVSVLFCSVWNIDANDHVRSVSRSARDISFVTLTSNHRQMKRSGNIREFSISTNLARGRHWDTPFVTLGFPAVRFVPHEKMRALFTVGNLELGPDKKENQSSRLTSR